MLTLSRRALVCVALLSPACVFSVEEVTPLDASRADMADMQLADAASDLSSPDQSGLDQAPDADPPDLDPPDAEVPDLEDMGPDITLCRSVAEQCAVWQLECGVAVDRFDECDANTLLDCGACLADQKPTCQANKCVSDCEPRSPEEVCQSYQCGTHLVNECGEDIKVECGDACGEGTTCVSTGQCCDQAQSRAMQRDALIQAGRCGEQPLMVCEVEEVEVIDERCAGYAQLNMKPDDFYQCVDGKCVCRPETDQQLCDAAGRSCGMLPPTTRDRCGTVRPGISCDDQCTSLTHKCCPGRGLCALHIATCN